MYNKFYGILVNTFYVFKNVAYGYCFILILYLQQLLNSIYIIRNKDAK